MLWLAKALFILARSRRGRKLLITAGVAAAELAQSERARELYAKAYAELRRRSAGRANPRAVLSGRLRRG